MSSTISASAKNLDPVIQQLTFDGIVRLSTAGSVDDGKSTLIGRLLYDTKSIYQDHLDALHKKSAQISGNSGALSLNILTDGLQAELEQGITIDVAYRYFESRHCRFVLADSPGHERYTRNMATAASQADCTIVLLDATQGITTQTKRHAFIASLFEVPRLLVAINKMDLLDYSQGTFERIEAEFRQLSERLSFKDIVLIPISALQGDNVVNRSASMSWYDGPTVLSYLESLRFHNDRNTIDFRFPVQNILRESGTQRLYAGQVASGSIRAGEEIVILPSGQRSRIKSIIKADSQLRPIEIDSVKAGDSVAIRLSDQRDLARGDLITRVNNQPQIASSLECMLLWFDEEPLKLGSQYLIRHDTKDAKAAVSALHYQIDVENLHRKDATGLEFNQIARCEIEVSRPLCVDPYRINRTTGSFILINPDTLRTAAAGLIIQRLDESARKTLKISKSGQVSQNLTREEGEIGRADREALLKSKAYTLWLTGLSGSGKSTIAKALEKALFAQGAVVFRLDGDNLRYGLNRDLGFSDHDRSENVRRTAEAARLLNEAGIAVICALISPFKADREVAKTVIGEDHFFEVYVATPIEVCEQRDPKGLYKKARAGGIVGFTGISAPYEEPTSAAMSLDASKCSIDEAVDKLVAFLTIQKLLR